MIGRRLVIFVPICSRNIRVWALSFACSRISASVTSSSRLGKGTAAFPRPGWSGTTRGSTSASNQSESSKQSRKSRSTSSKTGKLVKQGRKAINSQPSSQASQASSQASQASQARQASQRSQARNRAINLATDNSSNQRKKSEQPHTQTNKSIHPSNQASQAKNRASIRAKPPSKQAGKESRHCTSG